MTSFNRAVNYIIVKIQSQCIYNLINICIVQIVPIYNCGTNIPSYVCEIKLLLHLCPRFLFLFFNTLTSKKLSPGNFMTSGVVE